MAAAAALKVNAGLQFAGFGNSNNDNDDIAAVAPDTSVLHCVPST